MPWDPGVWGSGFYSGPTHSRHAQAPAPTPSPPPPPPGVWAVLVRVQAGGQADQLLDLPQELATCLAAAECGVGVPLLAVFGNGRVEAFLEATTLSSHHLRDGAVGLEIARSLAAFHHHMV